MNIDKDTDTMKLEQTTQGKLKDFLLRLAKHFPATSVPTIFTDIHLRMQQDSGELLAVDDEDQVLTRVVFESWIDNKDENFYEELAGCLRHLLRDNTEISDQLGIIKPYSFILEDEDGEHLAELYIVDDDVAIIGGDLMAGLDEELDSFFKHLLND